MIICAGDKESFDFAKPMGIGLINMAINLTRECIKSKPSEIVFVGTAGSYGKYKIGEIVRSTSASNVEIGSLKKLSYSPLMNVSRETLEDIMVNSSNYITSDAGCAKEFSDAGYDIENMEFFSVVEVAKKFDISAKGIFYITNYCDADAHEVFIKNHKTAMEKLTNYIKSIEK